MLITTHLAFNENFITKYFSKNLKKTIDQKEKFCYKCAYYLSQTSIYNANLK